VTARLRQAVSFAAGGLSLMAVTLGAQPRAPLTAGVKHARATIETVSADRRRVELLVTLHVEPGWHVSWRNPGETGLPTRLTWSLPAGVRAGAERWPVPIVTHTSVGDTFTLEGSVPWLVELAVDSAGATDRLLALTLRYGICREVCIPEQLTVQGALPAAGAVVRHVLPAAVAARLTTDAGVIAARRTRPDEICLDRVPMWTPGRVPDVLADSGLGLDASLRLREGQGRLRGSARATIPAEATVRTGVEVLFVRGTAGVTARLDLTRPTARCTAR
jgi:Disulphide bond corrector protein DsbC